jgi:hypothetical protein
VVISLRCYPTTRTTHTHDTTYTTHDATNVENSEQLLLFHQGTGLSDATDVHGEYIFPVVQMVNGYTGLTMGNHDIGTKAT